MNTDGEWQAAITAWRRWAIHNKDLTDAQRLMTTLPSSVVRIGTRAKLNGVELSSVKSEHKGYKAVNSNVMIKRESDECGGIEVGRIQFFVRYRRFDEQWQEVAAVKWYGVPERRRHEGESRLARRDWHPKLKCPQVDRVSKSDPTGNYWPLKDLIPTKVSLGPAADDHLYIVLHVDSDFLTRDYRI